MGTVIHLSKGHTTKAGAEPRRARGGGRVALVLGGGGITGAAYHLGVLTAMNAISERRSVNDFDLYVGTSSGSVIAACLANGITPEDMMLANLGHESASIPAIGADEILKPDRLGLLRSFIRWPLGVLGAARRYVGRPFDTSVMDGLGALAEGLPSAMYTTDGIERYLRELLEQPGRSNRFDDTLRKLLIVATNFDTAERRVFGEYRDSPVEISDAAAASAAIPMLYAPRHIGNNVYMDGGLRSTTNIDVAIAHGAKLIVCINPLVPYVHDIRHLIPTATGLPSRHVSQKGFPHVAAQSFRIMAAAQVEKELELISHAHPDVDVILVEPRRDDEHLFVFNLMDYASRERIARHAFETVAIDLVTRFPEYRKVLGRHGISISKEGLLDQLQSVVHGGEPRFIEAAEDETGASTIVAPES